eukprot:scaffold20761_cov70-Phaeocystis_antarctica.AAC.2
MQGLRNHVAQALARLAPAAPAEKEEHGQGYAYEGCERSCRCVPALHARRLTRVKVPRAIGDVAGSAVRPSGPWLAQHPICIRARRRVGRGCIGAASQIGALISQRGSRLLALGPDRASLARHIASGRFAVVVPFLTLAVFCAFRVLARLGKAGALLACASIDLVGQWLTSRAPRAHRTRTAFLAALQALASADGAGFASGRGRATSGAPRAHRTHGGQDRAWAAVIPYRAHSRTPWARLMLRSRRVTNDPSRAHEGKVTSVLARLKVVDAASVLNEDVAAQWCG